jgi:acetyltransferase-like isoleucine patch superfamily enzyme
MPFRIGRNVSIHETARINVKDGYIGNWSIVGEHAVIEGARVEIGHEAFIDAFAWIGGGRCFDPRAHLRAGDFLHMGRFSHINSARPVKIGHEFGCGLGTRVFSHGAYLPATDGFPVQQEGVQIGNRVWMPHAWVNPGVTVGDNVVVAAMSLVNRDLPSGCLAGGIPAKVIRENAYPCKPSQEAMSEILTDIICTALEIDAAICPDCTHRTHLKCGLDTAAIIEFDDTVFDIDGRIITGPCDKSTEIVKSQLRRNGIRFRYYADMEEGIYKPWLAS